VKPLLVRYLSYIYIVIKYCWLSWIYMSQENCSRLCNEGRVATFIKQQDSFLFNSTSLQLRALSRHLHNAIFIVFYTSWPLTSATWGGSW
jgi:hypothetical protein